MAFLPTTIELESVKAFVADLVTSLETYYKKLDILVDVIPVGSTVKGTFVSGEHDVDTYILSDDPQKAMNYATKVWEKNGYPKHAGELLIWCFEQDDFIVDLVFGNPKFTKKDTLKHADFFNKNLSSAQRAEVIAAKAFFKSKGLYSAEIGGITGVALEELVRQHQTFMEVSTFLYTNGDWWLQDPVMDEPRNLLASVTPKRKDQIQDACWEYLKLGFIDWRPYTSETFKREFSGLGEDVTFATYRRKKEKGQDFCTVWSAMEHTLRQLRNSERDLKGDFDLFLDEKQIVMAANLPKKLSETRIQAIPKRFSKEVESFKAVHPNFQETETSIIAEVPRRVQNPQEAFWKAVEKRMWDMGYVLEEAKDG